MRWAKKERNRCVCFGKPAPGAHGSPISAPLERTRGMYIRRNAAMRSTVGVAPSNASNSSGGLPTLTRATAPESSGVDRSGREGYVCIYTHHEVLRVPGRLHGDSVDHLLLHRGVRERLHDGLGVLRLDQRRIRVRVRSELGLRHELAVVYALRHRLCVRRPYTPVSPISAHTSSREGRKSAVHTQG